MANDVNGFLGGSCSNYTMHVEHQQIYSRATATSKHVEQVVEKKGFFASICESVGHWFGGAKDEVPQPKPQAPEPLFLQRSMSFKLPLSCNYPMTALYKFARISIFLR
jgi:hypothetical protein